MSSLLELYTVSSTVLGGASGGGVELELASGASLAGSAFGIGIPRAALADDAITPFSYCPFAFRIDDLKQAGVSSGTYTVDVYRNGVLKFTAELDDSLRDFVVGTSFAAGDSLKIVFSGAAGGTGPLVGTFVGVRL